MPASVRASEFSITLNPAVDPFFARALAFRPTDRFSTAREFAASLGVALGVRSVADAQADQPPSANVASVKASATGPAAYRAPSPSDATSSAQRMAAPPPRKMPQRATMLGMGTLEDEEPTIAIAPGARPPMRTMLGIGEARRAVAPRHRRKPPHQRRHKRKSRHLLCQHRLRWAHPRPKQPHRWRRRYRRKQRHPQTTATPAKTAAPQTAATPAKTAAPAVTASAAKAPAPAMAATPGKASPPAITAGPAKTAAPETPQTSPKAPPPAAAAPTPVIVAAPVIAIAPATSPVRARPLDRINGRTIDASGSCDLRRGSDRRTSPDCPTRSATAVTDGAAACAAARRARAIRSGTSRSVARSGCSVLHRRPRSRADRAPRVDGRTPRLGWGTRGDGCRAGGRGDGQCAQNLRVCAGSRPPVVC